MVIGVAMMSAMIPTVYGLNEASKGARESDKKRKEGNRKTRSNLVATCDLDAGTESQRQQIHNAKVYLGIDQKMYITKQPSPSMSPFNGYFFQHPDYGEDNLAALITRSCEEPPQMRWVFLSSDTREMRWGGRDDREGHYSEPFDLTIDGNVTLHERQSWRAVRVSDDDARELDMLDYDGSLWRLCFDPDSEGEMVGLSLKWIPSDS